MATKASLILDRKDCVSCDRCLPITEFHRSNQTPDGRKPWCRDCRRAREGESNRRRAAEWYAANRERALADRRERYRRNRDRELAQMREWAIRNPDRRAALKAADRIARRSAKGSATSEQIAARVAYWGNRCWVCRGAWSEIDHVKPIAANGTGWPANLRPICGPCNKSKGATWRGVDDH